MAGTQARRQPVPSRPSRMARLALSSPSHVGCTRPAAWHPSSGMGMHLSRRLATLQRHGDAPDPPPCHPPAALGCTRPAALPPVQQAKRLSDLIRGPLRPAFQAANGSAGSAGSAGIAVYPCARLRATSKARLTVGVFMSNSPGPVCRARRHATSDFDVARLDAWRERLRLWYGADRLLTPTPTPHPVMSPLPGWSATKHTRRRVSRPGEKENTLAPARSMGRLRARELIYRHRRRRGLACQGLGVTGPGSASERSAASC